jgi:hypothetical protein
LLGPVPYLGGDIDLEVGLQVAKGVGEWVAATLRGTKTSGTDAPADLPDLRSLHLDAVPAQQ